jgi:lysophospholipase
MLTSLLVFITLAATPSAHAIPETDFGPASALLTNVNGFFTSTSFEGAEGVKISAMHFGAPDGGPRGCLVLVPGKGEPALKYVEVASDLAGQGFGPIYAIDHRGQGFSGRLLPDPEKNTVDEFENYVTDFQLFVEKVVRKDPRCATPYLLAHSMGSAVVVAYLERVGADSPFRKVVLGSPMLKILYPSPLSEESVIRDTFLACYSPFGPRCDDYAPGTGPVDIDAPLSSSIVTHSLARHTFLAALYRAYPALMVGGPTVRWVRQSALADYEMRQPENLQRISARILLLAAGSDLIVDQGTEVEFCAQLGQNCHAVSFPGAFHELFMESDPVRDQALALAAHFFVP